MSNMALFADSTIPPEGRRAKVRQPLGSLAYLDIIPDNGGIILNLSEDGLAFQAVGPLHDQKLLQLVIQLPHSGTRVETAAEIMWLGSSSRQAGVRFRDLAPDARLQIRDWVESQVSPRAEALSPTDLESTGAANGGKEFLPPHETVPSDSRQQKWLSLVSEFEEKFERQEESPGLPEAKPESVPECALPAENDTPAPPPKPGILSWPSSSRSSQEQTTGSALAPSHEFLVSGPTVAESLRDRSIPPEGANELGSGSEHPTSSAAKKREEPTLRGSDADRAATSSLYQHTASVGSDFRLLRAAVVRSSPQEKGDDRPTKASARKGDSVRNQVALVIVFALFSVLCFGIGTWVGNLPIGNADQKTSTGPADSGPSRVAAPGITAQMSDPEDQVSPARDVEKDGLRPRPAAAEKTRLRPATTSTPSTIPQSPVQRVTIPAVQGSASDLPATSQPNRASSDDQHVKTPPTSDRAAQLSPVDLSPQNPTPQVVDGYVLRPSDRFNPCHLTYRVDPVYPLEAQQQGIEGSVKIHLAIAADGSVQTEKLISGPPQLVSAALDAAKYWRYLPALLNGQPVPTEKDVEIAFHLPPH